MLPPFAMYLNRGPDPFTGPWIALVHRSRLLFSVPQQCLGGSLLLASLGGIADTRRGQ